ncbi:MAG: ERF family protein [Roseburia sp.]
MKRSLGAWKRSGRSARMRREMNGSILSTAVSMLVMNAINPVLTKNHVFIVPEVLEQEKRGTDKERAGGALIYSICRIKYTFYAEDGSFIEAVTVGEGMDSGDKATNKAMAIAFKYACFRSILFPTEIESRTAKYRNRLHQNHSLCGDSGAVTQDQ